MVYKKIGALLAALIMAITLSTSVASAAPVVQKAANCGLFTCGDFVVDPASGTGVYCIPDWGWDLAPGGAGTGNGWWTAYVAPGQYASWISQCRKDGDTDGFWIDWNHKVKVYTWYQTSRGGSWIYKTTVQPNTNYKVRDSETPLLKVIHWWEN
jgi:hypothetical protein